MAAITAPKLHHFFPIANPRVAQVKSPLWGSPDTLPEYRKSMLQAGATEFVFPEGFSPARVADVLLERLEDKRVLPNREIHRHVAGSTVFGRELYSLDVADRRIVFRTPLEHDVTVHWFCMEKSVNFANHWVHVSIKDLLIQGTNYIDEDLIPPNSGLRGNYQGSWRCFPEIVSLPTQGIVKMSSDMRGFSYRGRMGFLGMDSFEYLVYNALGQVSNTFCFTFQLN